MEYVFLFLIEFYIGFIHFLMFFITIYKGFFILEYFYNLFLGTNLNLFLTY